MLLRISTCGPLGEMRGGSLLASLFAVPLVFILRLINWLSPHIDFILYAMLMLLCVLSLYVAARALSDQDTSVIVLDKMLGLSIAYWCIPFSFKIYAMGFLLFHCVNFMLPMLIAKTWDIHIDRFPHVIGIIASDVLAGISIHFLLRIVVWLAH